MFVLYDVIYRDVELSSMWGSTNNEYAVLSTIPPGSCKKSLILSNTYIHTYIHKNIHQFLTLTGTIDISLLSKSGLNQPSQAVPHLCLAKFDSRLPTTMHTYIDTFLHLCSSFNTM